MIGSARLSLIALSAVCIAGTLTPRSAAAAGLMAGVSLHSTAGFATLGRFTPPDPCAASCGAASVSRALNPQPLPPGLYSPDHPGPAGTRARALLVHPGRVCVAWGRVCVKVGHGTPTHPAPCGQYVYVCEKYG